MEKKEEIKQRENRGGVLINSGSVCCCGYKWESDREIKRTIKKRERETERARDVVKNPSSFLP